MERQIAGKFQEHFGSMTDPRVERSKLYPLQEILFVLLCGSICGAESWRDFVMFGEEKLGFLREYYPFSAGIPCKCQRRLNIDPPCRSNIDPGRVADIGTSNCG